MSFKLDDSYTSLTVEHVKYRYTDDIRLVEYVLTNYSPQPKLTREELISLLKQQRLDIYTSWGDHVDIIIRQLCRLVLCEVDGTEYIKLVHRHSEAKRNKWPADHPANTIPPTCLETNEPTDNLGATPIIHQEE